MSLYLPAFGMATPTCREWQSSWDRHVAYAPRGTSRFHRGDDNQKIAQFRFY